MNRREPAQLSRRDRREEILKASLHLFAERGFHGTSMRDIASSAGITEGLIYHYFASKRDLFRAIIEEYSFLPLLKTLPDLAGQLDLRGLLTVLARGFYDILHQNRELTRLLLQEVQVFPEEKEAFFADAVGRSIAELARLLEDRMSESARREVDPKVAARLFFNALLAFFVEQEILGGRHLLPADEHTYFQHLIDMFERRLGPGFEAGPRLVKG
ncbi:MAG TPA: TetR/AcrR family transcriptional regulator [Actinomycetota bacterium]|jgi:AcrR family transcriptional regulator|nr:TetR/AcrR family transcriptional regulator [Actinomycetota bacterium]